VQIGLNDLKTAISIINDKERFGDPATVEENELWKDGKKLKTMENTSINLYCIDFIMIKKMQKIGKNFYRPNSLF